jgi:hypothetical protein
MTSKDKRALMIKRVEEKYKVSAKLRTVYIHYDTPFILTDELFSLLFEYKFHIQFTFI